MHLQDLPSRLISAQQIFQEHGSLKNNFTMHSQSSKLTLDGLTKTLFYDPVANLPMLCTEKGLTKICNMTQDGSGNDPLTHAQRQLLCWHRRLARVDFNRIKDFSRQGFLPKEIAR